MIGILQTAELLNMFQNIFEIRQRDSAQTRILYSLNMCMATTRMTIMITLHSDKSPSLELFKIIPKHRSLLSLWSWKLTFELRYLRVFVIYIQLCVKLDLLLLQYTNWNLYVTPISFFLFPGVRLSDAHKSATGFSIFPDDAAWS